MLTFHVPWRFPSREAVLGALAVAASFASHCSIHEDCSSCVADSTILGTCRFCPVDQTCHDPGAVATNPCSKEQNIVTTSGCANPTIPTYSEAKAKKMLMFSSAAYAPKSGQQACLDRAVGKGYSIFYSMEIPCAAGLNLSGSASCAAFGAISDADKRIVLSYRGSVSGDQILAEAIKNLGNYVEYVTGLGDASIGKYWLDVAQQLSAVANAVADKVKANVGYELWVTGHSLGAALASLGAMSLQQAVPDVKISSYTFGQPRVGLYDYARAHDLAIPDAYRVIHDDDIVPHIPWCRHVKYEGWLPLPVCAAWGGAVLPNWYHHGTEVLYKGDQMIDGNFVVCHGVPHNEDLTTHCADEIYAADLGIPGTLSQSSLAHHKNYFGVEIGDLCSNLQNGAASLLHV